MKIALIGGGSGGHITPLLAVARELKRQQPGTQIIGICEQKSRFVHLYKDEPAVDVLYEIPAGKYRRYGGQSLLKRVTDVETLVLNGRDVFRTLKGYRQARRLLKKVQPDAMLIKGGFVAVPVGLAASRLGIPFMTHDSDSTPGMANRIVSRWAAKHATGMPAELYDYPAERTAYTGIPVSDEFVLVTDKLREQYRQQLEIEQCKQVITVVGGSLGGDQLNRDVCEIARSLMDSHDGLGIVHIAGASHQETVRARYDAQLAPEQAARVLVSGFVSDVAVRQGAADVVVSRAGATQTAELAVQALPVIFVPGRLAGSHQDKNAAFFAGHQAALVAPFGDTQTLGLHINELLTNHQAASQLAKNLARFGRPDAAGQLADMVANLVHREQS